jgi:hypothetical protein
MAKKAKPAAKSAKKSSKTVSRKPERSKGELSSEDLDSVAGGFIIINSTPIDAIKKVEKIAPTVGGALPSYKDLLQ